MKTPNPFKIAALAVGDALALYASLFVMLILRYGANFYEEFKSSHALPFTFMFALWMIVFYISGLYDLRRLRNNLDFLKTLFLTILVNGLLATAFFYFLPALKITPKTNLFIFIALFTCIEVFWRRMFNKLASSGEAPNRVLLIGNSNVSEELAALVSANPQMGYCIAARLPEVTAGQSIREEVGKHGANVVVVPRRLKHNQTFTSELYKLLSGGIEVRDLAHFYELVTRKIPLSEVEEVWFLEHVANQPKFYEQLKRAGEILFALLLQIALLPLEAVLALVTIIVSPGPVIYKQTRVGKDAKTFTLYKFRTMRVDAERAGAQWSGIQDDRVTPFGKFLRWTHLDELPQLVNIMKGDLSFVGPRPERPEFVESLKKHIPYYEMRHIVHPGVTGWAQIHHHYAAPDADSYEKLQYDIYYIKNRSLVLDLAIIVKTLRSVFINHT